MSDPRGTADYWRSLGMGQAGRLTEPGDPASFVGQPCGGCSADAGEPCRPDCIGAALKDDEDAADEVPPTLADDAHELYDGLVRLCQQYGITTAHTYDLLHLAVDSVLSAVPLDD